MTLREIHEQSVTGIIGLISISEQAAIAKEIKRHISIFLPNKTDFNVMIPKL